MNLLIVRML